MMTIDTTTPGGLAELAGADCDRLIEKIGATKVDFSCADVQHIASGSGPAICLKSGYEAFKAAYLAGTHALRERITSEMSANPDCRQLELAFVVEDESGFADYGRHVWNLYK